MRTPHPHTPEYQRARRAARKPPANAHLEFAWCDDGRHYFPLERAGWCKLCLQFICPDHAHDCESD